MERIKLNETFSGEVALISEDSLNESTDFSSLIDGKDIIGMVEGQFFQPDGMSRNKRWYSRQLWENVLACADVRSRLANRTMYGEIGHSDGPVTDMTLRSGDVSHIIADLWIDEKGRGMGRAYILDTPKGRLLKTYLGAKSKLKVSTRGEGVYLDGQLHDGCPIIDPDTYELQTVDFVLNPGFMETSAKLTTKREDYTTPITEQVITKQEKEINRMDTDKYIAELKERIEELKADNKSLSEELKSKETELLQYKYEESAEIKKISEAYAPFKKMGVSAKTLNETLKKVQGSLQNAKSKNAKLTEELDAYKAKCGQSLEEVDEGLAIADKALDTVAEYQKLGTVAELKELKERSEALIPKLQQLSALTEYRKLGSVEDLKTLMEKCQESLPKLKEMAVLEDYKKLGSVKEIQRLSKQCESVLPRLKKLDSLKAYESFGSVDEIKALTEKFEELLPQLSILEEYKKLGSVEEIQKLSKKAEAMLPKLATVKEAQKLIENSKKAIAKLSQQKSLEEAAKKAHRVIQQYMETVGSINQARELANSRKETIKKVNVKEALEVSKKFGCTVESAAKLLKKYGAEQATRLLESKISKVEPNTNKEALAESVELVEKAGEMEEQKVNAKPENKSAKDFLKSGMVNNFNLDALGKKSEIKDINKIEGNNIPTANQAKELLKAYRDAAEAEVEKAPKTEPEKKPEEAEKLAKDLLK